jgi:glucose-6-phosphate 1-dehydrogenase
MDARQKSDKASAAAQAPPEAPACTMVIFGARGDLNKRLLTPALYNLAHDGLLADGFRILGVDHGDIDAGGLRKLLSDFLHDLASDPQSEFGKATIDAKSWSWVAGRMDYQRGGFEDEATYAALAKALKGDVLFYLATAPRFFGDIVEHLGKAGLLKEPAGAFRRVVIEKPFGDDLASAKALNKRILKYAQEPQLYRIDHFLGKETIRNIMVTRFGNGVFEPLWSRLHIDSVQITAAETVGVEDRGGYYDPTGALRDMVPNHLFEVLGMVAMEPPNSFDADAVRAEKGRVIEAIRVLTPAEAMANSVRGQYGGGTVGGKAMPAYRASPDVARDSRTETYVALKLAIDNWRWSGVPFYLRTGKATSAHVTEVAIQFKAAPKTLFQALPTGASKPNVLVLRVQPNQGISLLFDAKQPGPDVALQDVRMDFRYADWFKAEPATGYETLLYDCFIGDQTLFKRGEDIEAAWRAVMPFLKAWEHDGDLHRYAAGSAGPKAADALLARDGRAWRPLSE